MWSARVRRSRHSRTSTPPHAVNENQHVNVMTERYTKLTRAMRTKKTLLLHVANVFCDSWVILHGRPPYVLIDNGVQFTSKLFATPCIMLDMTHLRTTVYHPQKIRQVKQYNFTIDTLLRHYCAKNQKALGTYAQSLTYSSNSQM